MRTACGRWASRPTPLFFQAEDGIRYHCVTGVQTCALPISMTIGRRIFLKAEAGMRDAEVTGVQTCALQIYPWCGKMRTGPPPWMSKVSPRYFMLIAEHSM